MARVLLLVSGRMYGGGQRVVLDLIEEGRNAGISVGLCFLGEPIAGMPCVSAEVVEYDGRYNRPITLVDTARRLRDVIGQIKPDVVHSHGWDASIIASLALVDKSVSHLIHIHTSDSWVECSTMKQRFRWWLTRWMLHRRGTCVATVSQAVLQHWSQSVGLPMRSVVIRNGVDIRRFSALQTNGSSNIPGTLGVAARLQPAKGLDELFDALAMLATDNVHPNLVIAGDGAMRDTLEVRADRLGLARQVTFLGFVRDMTEFYRQVDIYVSPSRSEGLPLSVLEAMATAVPVVATDVGGTAEVVRSGIDGFVVPAHAPESLAAALRALLEQPDRRKEMGANARQRVETAFSRARFCDEVFSLYREVLDRQQFIGSKDAQA